MVTSYELKILEWDEKPQTKKQTKNQTSACATSKNFSVSFLGAAYARESPRYSEHVKTELWVNWLKNSTLSSTVKVAW